MPVSDLALIEDLPTNKDDSLDQEGDHAPTHNALASILALIRGAVLAAMNTLTGHAHAGGEYDGATVSHDDLSDLASGNPHPQYLTEDSTVDVNTNATRGATIAHRTGVAAADKLATPGALTTSQQNLGGAGHLALTGTFYVGVAALNAHGQTLARVAAPVTLTGSNNAIRVAFAQVVGATKYAIFCSTSSTPLWVRNITEANRASGCVLSTVGAGSTVDAGGAAGSVDVAIAGTGVATNAAGFQANTAYKWDTVTPDPAPIDGTGYSKLSIKAVLTQTGDDVAFLQSPTLNLVAMLQSVSDPNLWTAAEMQTVDLGTDGGQSNKQEFEVIHNGAPGIVILVDAISANTTVDLKAELV